MREKRREDWEKLGCIGRKDEVELVGKSHIP